VSLTGKFCLITPATGHLRPLYMLRYLTFVSCLSKLKVEKNGKERENLCRETRTREKSQNMIRIPYEQNLIKKVRTILGKAGICEQVAYLLKIEVYPNCSDMNELGAIAGGEDHE